MQIIKIIFKYIFYFILFLICIDIIVSLLHLNIIKAERSLYMLFVRHKETNYLLFNFYFPFLYFDGYALSINPAERQLYWYIILFYYIPMSILVSMLIFGFFFSFFYVGYVLYRVHVTDKINEEYMKVWHEKYKDKYLEELDKEKNKYLEEIEKLDNEKNKYLEEIEKLDKEINKYLTDNKKNNNTDTDINKKE